MPASKRASSIGVSALFTLSVFQISLMSVMVSRSLHHGAFGLPPMCFLGG